MAKFYYTNKVIISEIPKYMPIEKLTYEISFSNTYKKISGKLSASKAIDSVKIETNKLTAKLTIKIENVIIKNIKLNISDNIEQTILSFKSTISQTCDNPNTICRFELKIKVYKIDKISNRAILLSFSEIEKLQDRINEQSGYFILRLNNVISKTSKETIDWINNPDLIQNKYIKQAMKIFQKISAINNEYPNLIYRDLMKSLFEHFLSGAKDPDTIIDEIGDIFGIKVEDCYTNEIYAFYHIYEALVRKSSADAGYDKIQHFVYSAVTQYNSTKVGTDVRQYGAEIWDLRKGSSVWNDTKSDMEANNLGQSYGQQLYKKYHPIRAALRGID